MKKLALKLDLLSCKKSLQFIDTATIPVIKMEMDLQKIREMKRKNKSLVPDKMKLINIDITFEDLMLGQNTYFDDAQLFQLTQVNLGIKCISYVKQLQN